MNLPSPIKMLLICVVFLTKMATVGYAQKELPYDITDAGGNAYKIPEATGSFEVDFGTNTTKTANITTTITNYPTGTLTDYGTETWFTFGGTLETSNNPNKTIDNTHNSLGITGAKQTFSAPPPNNGNPNNGILKLTVDYNKNILNSTSFPCWVASHFTQNGCSVFLSAYINFKFEHSVCLDDIESVKWQTDKFVYTPSQADDGYKYTDAKIFELVAGTSNTLSSIVSLDKIKDKDNTEVAVTGGKATLKPSLSPFSINYKYSLNGNNYTVLTVVLNVAGRPQVAQSTP